MEEGEEEEVVGKRVAPMRKLIAASKQQKVSGKRHLYQCADDEDDSSSRMTPLTLVVSMSRRKHVLQESSPFPCDIRLPGLSTLQKHFVSL